MPLLPEQKEAIRRASKAAISAAFARIATNLLSKRWLPNSNDYTVDCTEVLRSQTSVLPPGVHSSDLAEYIAASAPLHCMDGWSLLGRALESHARGDIHTAIHLAYYAELRAAMSLLASEGIGIFDDRHFVVTGPKLCEPLGEFSIPKKSRGKTGGGTHNLAWLALEYWSTLARAGNLLTRIVRPGGIAFGDWLDEYGAPSLSRAMGKRWLQQWGLDLRRLSEGKDRDARNQASYRPTQLILATRMRAAESSSCLRSLWLLAEPQAAARFAELDRHLLRVALDYAKDALPGGAKARSTRLRKMLGSLINNPLIATQWRQFLTHRIHSGTPTPFTDAAEFGEAGDKRLHLQIISRAVLLLRVATGGCEELLAGAHISRKDLHFWWSSIGEERGLWQPLSPPGDFLDLWADVLDAAGDLGNWETSNKKTNRATWREAMSGQLSILGETERIALWGLGL